MKTLRRAAPIAALAALALGLSACDTLSPDDPEPTQPEVSIAVPEGFNATTPAWKALSDLPSSDATEVAVSPDGKNFAYAERSRDGQSISVGQVDLVTGARTEPATTDTLQSADTDSKSGDFSLFFSGNRLVVVHSGASDEGEGQWQAALFSIGSDSAPKVLTETVEPGANVQLPSEGSGPIVSATKGTSTTSYLIDTETSEIAEHEQGATKKFDGCGDPTNCDLALYPTVQYMDTTVSTFKEGAPAAQSICAQYVTGKGPDAESGFNRCLTGFGTDEWTSQDPEIAPSGTVINSAHLHAAGGSYIVGAWRAKDGQTTYRTINVNKPGASHAEVTCERPPQGTATNPIHSSPNGKYLVAGSLTFDVASGKGACLQDTSTTLTAVDNSGTAWGSTDSSWGPDRYASTVISAGSDGAVTSRGVNVAAPISFVSANAHQVGVFAVSEDAVTGATVVAGYPVSP